jgi:hypothetical protein
VLSCLYQNPKKTILHKLKLKLAQYQGDMEMKNLFRLFNKLGGNRS